MGSGRLTEIYGINLLFEAWKIVVKEIKEGLLIIVGGNEYIRRKYMKYPNVLFIGKKPNTELPDWINISDVCVAPRTPGFPHTFYNDKDSNKISEYAARLS